MRFPSFSALLLSLLLEVVSTSEYQDSPPDVPPVPPHPQCGIYMAGSTLGDTTNLGMYAGQDIPAGIEVQQEIAIPLLFRNWDAPDYYETDDGQLWDRYIWEGDVANIETYDNTDTIQTKAVFVPGIGCTINSVLDMNNVESTHGSTYDTAGLHRSRDPGAGAFTPYWGTHTTSVEKIEAGSEIFAAYGDTWIPEIEGAQITFNKNLEAAEQFLRDDYYRFVQDRKSQLKADVLEGLWNFTRDFPIHSNQIFTVLPRNVKWTDIESKLVETQNSVEKDNGDDDGSQATDGYSPKDAEASSSNDRDSAHTPSELYWPDSMVTRYFIRQQSKRSIDWLQRYGRCCDHIKADKSTVPQAGRGAFATRDLPKGTIVGYSPLIHVGLEGEKLFNIPYGSLEPPKDEDGNRLPLPPPEQRMMQKPNRHSKFTKGDNGDDEEEEGYYLKDLVINYSFGHRDSTITLTPYGSMVNYINHAAGDKANVKVVWPDEEMVAHKPDWLSKNITTLRHTIDKIGLSFDYVALRDIKEGEEILMDYGPEWEQAWRQHVTNWEPLDWAEEYIHSSDWPKDEPYRTEQELEANPYPENLETMCVESYRQGRDSRTFTWLPVLRKNNLRVHCSVLKRNDNPLPGKRPTYQVEMILHVDEETDEEETIIVDHVPHKWIFLVDRVKSADWHMKNTFRHKIQIPDDIMPEAWKNKKQPEGTTTTTKNGDEL